MFNYRTALQNAAPQILATAQGSFGAPRSDPLPNTTREVFQILATAQGSFGAPRSDRFVMLPNTTQGSFGAPRSDPLPNTTREVFQSV